MACGNTLAGRHLAAAPFGRYDRGKPRVGVMTVLPAFIMGAFSVLQFIVGRADEQ